MSEQKPVQTPTAERETAQTSACPHPEAVSQRWGDPISEERQAELQAIIEVPPDALLNQQLRLYS